MICLQPNGLSSRRVGGSSCPRRGWRCGSLRRFLKDSESRQLRSPPSRPLKSIRYWNYIRSTGLPQRRIRRNWIKSTTGCSRRRCTASSKNVRSKATRRSRSARCLPTMGGPHRGAEQVQSYLLFRKPRTLALSPGTRWPPFCGK